MSPVEHTSVWVPELLLVTTVGNSLRVFLDTDVLLADDTAIGLGAAMHIGSPAADR
jgi:hypothetical protein